MCTETWQQRHSILTNYSSETSIQGLKFPVAYSPLATKMSSLAFIRGLSGLKITKFWWIQAAPWLAYGRWWVILCMCTHGDHTEVKPCVSMCKVMHCHKGIVHCALLRLSGTVSAKNRLSNFHFTVVLLMRHSNRCRSYKKTCHWISVALWVVEPANILSTF